MTEPKMPEPDTHCFDDDTGRDVWSHSPAQVRAYAARAVEAERERIRAALMDMHRRTADHNYYHFAANQLFGTPTSPASLTEEKE